MRAFALQFRFKATLTAVLQFIFPSFCSHCDEKNNRTGLLLCKECVSLIEWLDPISCCSICSCHLEDKKGIICLSCRGTPLYLQPHRSLFLAGPPILSLFNDFKKTKHPEVIKTLTSLLVIGLNKFSWSSVEMIVPFPESRLKTLLFRNQESFILARALAKMLHIPFCPILTPIYDGTEYKIRINEKEKKKHSLVDKKVLLLIGCIESGKELQDCRSELRSFFPKSIHSMAFLDDRNNND